MHQRPKHRRTNQPKYVESTCKRLARQKNMEIYFELTGLTSLPSDRNYWTLCNVQDSSDGSEIVQMCNEGFLTKKQFHGVDFSRSIIKQNRKWHPKANWYCGDWLKVVRGHPEFRPALVYLDTLCFVDRKIILDVVVSTMSLCPVGTVLLVNGMKNDPRSKTICDPDKLITNIGNSIGSFELKKWAKRIRVFDYCGTGKTNMATFAFHKKD